MDTLSFRYHVGIGSNIQRFVLSIGVNRKGGVNRNTHQKGSLDLNFSKFKIHMNSFVHKLVHMNFKFGKLRSEEPFW